MPGLHEDWLGGRNVTYFNVREANKHIYEATLRLIDHSRELQDPSIDTRLKIHLEAVKKILKECIGDQVDLSKLSLQAGA